MLRRRVWQVDAGVQGEQVAQQGIQQQVACPVGEGGDPLPHRGAGRSLVVRFSQLAHQLPPAQASEKVERNHLLQQRDDKMAMGVKKVGQQAVGPTADLAAHPLDADAVVGFPGERPAFVGAPADQRTSGLAVGMGTAVRHGERAALGENCGDVFFDGTEKWLYNDHVLGTPPLVVRPPSTEPRREVSSFLLKVPAIIPVPVDSVKPDRSLVSWLPLLERSINVTRCPGIFQALIMPDHLFWPKEALF